MPHGVSFPKLSAMSGLLATGQEMLADRWLREGVVDRGVVLAVYRAKPSVEKPPYRAADWRPDPVAARWRSELQVARLVDDAPSGGEAE